MTSFFLVIPILTTLLQLKYQGVDQNNSPFTTHSRTICVAASASAVYYLSYIAVMRRLRRPFDVAAHVCLICCGYASVASLASLLFPASIRPYVYLIFVLISAAELWYYYKRVIMDEAYRRRLNRFFNNLRRVAAIPFGRRDLLLPI